MKNQGLINRSLSFAQQLVEYLKGSIKAESGGKGHGATFIIELKKGKNIFNEKDFIPKK
ncbi:MAG: HAMP domain-containing histidine kinase [Spirochaetes bacterium]|nr:HAMP domain-containing histidine kinase [Spirochaetota bacterium]